MRKRIIRLLAVFAIVLSCSILTNAQELGVRFGGMSGHGGAAVDGVFTVGQFSRVHANLGFFNSGFAIEGLWDFLYRPLDGEAFNWYLGFGPSLAVWDDNFYLGVSGEIGLEYRFASVPIALGVDWRPTFWIIEDTDFNVEGFGLNIRYIFGNKNQ